MIVFVFTALWHGDFEFKLLLWGSLMSLLIIPEILIKKYYYSTHNVFIKQLRNNIRINRYIHANGAVINIIILFIANLIGFGPGYDVVFEFLRIIVFKWYCIAAFIIVYFIVFCGALVMLHADYAQQRGYGWNSILRLKDDDKKNEKQT